LIERTGHSLASGRIPSSFVVTDVVDHEITAQVFEPLCPGDHVLADHLVSHHFATEIRTSFDHTASGFFMSSRHDNDVSRTGLGHHLGFQVAAIHGFEIGNDGRVREFSPQRADAVKSLGKNQRRARF
jgi:hypothetical protein